MIGLYSSRRAWVEFGVAGGFSLAILLPFLLFVALGWPGEPDPCISERSGTADNTCYCEQFDRAEIGEPGVRQPFNTWSNLYSILTGAFVAFFVYCERALRIESPRPQLTLEDRCLLSASWRSDHTPRMKAVSRRTGISLFRVDNAGESP